MKNKKIGIIGGVGPQATNYLYSKIIELSQTKYNAKHNADYPHLIIETVPVPDFISDKNNMGQALVMFRDCVNRFNDAGVERICIASNTCHILLPDLKNSTNIEFLSMIELVSEKCTNFDYKKVALLGTPVLTESGLYKEALGKRNIELITPEKEELQIVEELIRGVMAGEVTHKDKSKYIDLINKLFSQGAEGIILGCTELPLAVDYTVLGKRIINSDEVLAEGIVDFYYK